MKKSLISAALAAIVATSTTHSQVLYNHNAQSWTAGDVVGQNGWTAHSGAAAVPVQVDTSGTMTLAQGSSSREDVSRGVGTIGLGETYYAAFNFSTTAPSTPTATYFAHFKNATTGFSSRIFVTSFAGEDFTLGFGNGALESTWATGLTFGVEYTVVASYTLSGDGLSSTASLWLNPTDSASTSIAATGTIPNNVEAFAFRQAAGNTTQLVSNLVVGTDFDQTLAAVPEPSTVALAGLSLFAMLYLFRRRRTAKI